MIVGILIGIVAMYSINSITASQIERQLYPVNAKYNLILEGINMEYVSRSKDAGQFTETYKLEMEQFHGITKKIEGFLELKK